MITATATGPLFEKPDLLAALVRAGNQAEAIYGPAVRRAYSGGIVRSGTPRFGHVAEIIRTATTTNGWTVTTRIVPQGKSAFVARFLELGTRAPHKGGVQRGYIFPRDRRDRAASRRGHAAALRLPGGRFRRRVITGGMRPFRVLERVREAEWPRVQTVFARELGKEVGAS